MNPTNNWIASFRKSGPGELSAYWIDTGFVEVPDVPVRDDVLDQLDAEATDIPPELAEYAAIVEHEQVHWTQAHAFGYGRFQSRIHQCISEIAESFFGIFSPEQVDTLMVERTQHKPVLAVNKSYFPVRQPRYGPIGTTLQQHWWNLRFLKYELDAPATDLKRCRSTRLRYGLSVLYSIARADVSEVALMGTQKIRDNALCYAPHEDYGKAMEWGGFPWLSASAICECAAVLNQHFSYAYMQVLYRRLGLKENAERLRRTHESSWSSKEMTHYGDAFRVFAHFNPGADLNDARPLSTLNLLCCLALDGQFVPEVPVERPSWIDISPPLRFIALARAVALVGMVPSDRLCDIAPDQYAQYREKLCDAAGIDVSLSSGIRIGTYDEGDLSPVDYVRKLSDETAEAAFKLARLFPGALFSPSETATYRSDELERPEIAACAIARLPPLLVIGGHAFPNGIDYPQFAKCTLGAAYLRILDQLFSDTGRMDYSGLPTNKVGKAAARSALDTLRKRTERRLDIEL